MKVKKDDKVLVIAGKNRKATGKVMRTFQKTDKIVVEKVNMRKKHVKKTSNRPGEIITYEAPIHASNVKIICPHCECATRAGYIILKTKKKQRVCKKCKESLDKATTTTTRKKS